MCGGGAYHTNEHTNEQSNYADRRREVKLDGSRFFSQCTLAEPLGR